MVFHLIKKMYFNSLQLHFSQTISKFVMRNQFLCTKSWLSTIFALSSGYGKCGVAVIRISGPQASKAVLSVAGFRFLPLPRHANLRKLKDPQTKEVLDRGIVIWFPGPNSFTGEDSCELQIHGGPAVISAVLNALKKLHGFRLAEPGEFTKRAFHAGKLDLTEVEGLADLIQAETEAQRKQALLQVEGTLSHLYNSWSKILIKSVANVEAYIDFSEDDNIEDDVVDRVDKTIHNLIAEIQNHLSDGRCGERLRNGVRTVIVGEPNVGKSSLLNALCQRPAAIVTPIAGTTRDVVETHLNVGGYPILLADTAGLHSSTHDEVEMEGMTRARTCARNADLLLLVVDATKLIDKPEVAFDTFLKEYVKTIGLEEMHLLLNKSESFNKDEMKQFTNTKHCVVVLNKMDLVQNINGLQPILHKYDNVSTLSCKTEEGFPTFLNKISENLVQLCGSPSHEIPSLTQGRHRFHLTNCLASLQEYFKYIEVDVVLAAQELRNALRHIGKITGHVSTEQILDVIFKEFCIGK